MPRPRPVPHPTTDHEQHDVLLVAQRAAGDPLEDAREHEAVELVSSCGACASLAADLRAISGAVAWEPVPPRRRDFRIDATTAETLRGSRFTRFLRRLSPPQSRAFSPAAVGVMAIGLLFVVAGTVWPAADLDATTVPARVAPVPTALAQDPPAQEPPVDGLAGTVESALDEPAPGEGNAGAELEADAEALTDEAPALELRTEDVLDQAAKADDAAAAAAAEELGAVAPAARAEADTESIERALPQATVPDAREGSVGEGAVSEEAAAAPAPSAAPAPAAAADLGLDVETASPAASAGARSVESALIVTGAVLATAGALLLLLAWLARRAADPLLR